MKNSREIVLPARDTIARSIDNGTGEDYHLVRLYYSWYSGWFYRNRLQMIANLLGDLHVDHLLEVGTGSGIFVKQLLRYANRVSGIDIHQSYTGVQSMLQAEGVDLSRVQLQYGSILEIPFPDATFDAAVCISVLEHFQDPRPAVRELRRVVKPGGTLALGFPARNPATSFLFGALGYRAHELHPASHTDILAAIRAELTIEQSNSFPFDFFPMYCVCKAKVK
ncbi:MAG: class I SAM-dependent methyltransferase [Chloroflexota bacterium]